MGPKCSQTPPGAPQGTPAMAPRGLKDAQEAPGPHFGALLAHFWSHFGDILTQFLCIQCYILEQGKRAGDRKGQRKGTEIGRRGQAEKERERTMEREKDRKKEQENIRG